MAVGDVKAQSFLYSWMIPFIIAILAYTLLKKYGNTFKDRLE
jgi:ABC-type polysaccharide/polyol phosphate export permease